ncbi:MAG TPA: hypothetical protein VN089_13620 [Duganella sp.]|nr:hypothetical protein [Duganella sp.]
MLLSAALACLAGAHSQAGELRAQIVAKCPNQPEKPVVLEPQMGPLAAIFIPELIATGVDIAATALAEAAKANTVTLVADSNTFNMYTLTPKAELSFNENVGCLLVYLPATKESRGKNQGAPAAAWFTKVSGVVDGMMDPPELYAEFEIDTTSQGSLKLKLIPQLLVVSRPLQEGFARKKQRGYVFALSFKDETSQTSYGAATFTFEDIPVGAWTKDGRPGTKQTDWPLDAAVPKMPENADITEAIAAQKSKTAPYRSANALRKQQYSVTHAALPDSPPDSFVSDEYAEALRQFCKKIDDASPPKASRKIADARCPVQVFMAKRDFSRAVDAAALKVGGKWADAFFVQKCAATKVSTADGPELCQLPAPDIGGVGNSQISVSVVETSEASEFIQRLSKVFSGKKEEIKTVLNDKYNPARREELARGAATKGLDARNAYRIAALNVQQTEAQLQEAADKPESARATLRIQLTQAKIDANKAAIAAGAAVPYPEFD